MHGAYGPGQLLTLPSFKLPDPLSPRWLSSSTCAVTLHPNPFHNHLYDHVTPAWAPDLMTIIDSIELEPALPFQGSGGSCQRTLDYTTHVP